MSETIQHNKFVELTYEVVDEKSGQFCQPSNSP
jgi:hypothetical protein